MGTLLWQMTHLVFQLLNKHTSLWWSTSILPTLSASAHTSHPPLLPLSTPTHTSHPPLHPPTLLAHLCSLFGQAYISYPPLFELLHRCLKALHCGTDAVRKVDHWQSSIFPQEALVLACSHHLMEYVHSIIYTNSDFASSELGEVIRGWGVLLRHWCKANFWLEFGA